ncbi:MAG: ATP-dependent endonuclease [Cyanobacteria bacterium HKST-UBA02]|nr:ATP-dependent endonuclease [Cyanobacteria bacterium HKST-UBA02]
MVQKILSFEEPSSKWSQIRKALRKQLKRSNGGKVDIESLSLKEQCTIFAQLFGNGNGDQLRQKSNKTVSNRLALEDLKRHRTIAFDSFRSTLAGASLEDIQDSSSGSETELEESERLYLELMTRSTPDWCRLLSAGPWQDDERALAIADFLKDINEGGPESDSGSAWETTMLEHRQRLPGEFLPRALCLVEGQTEQILLPVFGDLLSYHFDSAGIRIVSCGGARQVVRNYLSMKETVALPIIAVLDGDVSEEAEVLADSLRSGDRLITLRSGEIEDTFKRDTILRLARDYFNSTSIEKEDIPAPPGCARGLAELARTKGLPAFDKVGFARTAADLLAPADLPDEGRVIVETIKEIVSDRALRF